MANPPTRLGLVCQISSGEVRFRTITRTRLHQLGPAEQEAALLSIYRDNIDSLGRAFRFCEEARIPLFRLSSDLFPFADTDAGAGLLVGLSDDLARLGRQAGGLRLVMHPDQYVVLSSVEPRVVDNARKVLGMHGLVLDLLGQPRSPFAAIIIHGGKGGRGEALAREVRRLPEPVRSRLVMENDERAYGAGEILSVCGEAGVPMVFDAHHHVIHDRLESYDDPAVAAALGAAAETWPDPSWQLVHISNGRSRFHDMAHSDFISQMPACYRRAPWIEVEAKAKDQAIARLRAAGW